MKQWSINISGDYLDSFIYMGILFLFDFDGKINVYNFEKMLNERLKLEKNFNKIQEFRKIFSKTHDRNRESKQFSKVLDIDLKFLQNFKTDEFDIGEWITDINVTSKFIYFSSSQGVKKKRFHVEGNNSETYGKFSPDTIDLFLDTKVYSFSSSVGRTVLCCGEEGAIYGLENNHKFNYLKDDKSDDWIDCQWYSLTTEDILSINSERFITYKKMKLEKNIQNIKQKIHRTKNHLYHKLRDNKTSKVIKGRIQKINTIQNSFELNLRGCYASDLEKTHPSSNMQYLKQKKLNNTALFYQLGDEIFCQLSHSNNPHKVSDNDEITNWRIFPNARTHFNQLHVIYDNYVSINGFEINFHNS